MDSPDANIPCIRCGYDLYGLPVHGFCPECGLPIGATIASGLSDPADPVWLNKLVRGARLATIGPLAGFVLFAIMGGIGMGLEKFHWESWKYIGIAGVIAGSAGLLMVPIGMWLISTRDPRLALTPARPDAALAMRIGLLVMLPGTILSFSSLGWPSIAFLTTPLFITVSPIGVVGLVVMIAFTRRMNELAWRAGQPDMLSRNHLLLRWCVIAWSAGLISVLAGLGPIMGITLFVAAPFVMITGALLLLTPLLIADRIKVWAERMRLRCDKVVGPAKP